MELRFIKLDERAVVPARAHPGDAGHDLSAIAPETIAPGERKRVHTGIAVAIPGGCAGLVMPRSGLAIKHGISLVNAPGLIDSGYRGELQVLLLNTDRRQSFRVEAGDRVAQLVIVRYEAPSWSEVESFDVTTRGDGGFGSSGV